MDNDLLYQVAVSMVPGIGDVHAKTLINHFGDAASVFKAGRRQLELIEGIGISRARSIKSFNDFKACEQELMFMEKYKITPLFMLSPAYPARLQNCYDSPPMLYYRGNADLNCGRILSVVGTRLHSPYGKQACEELIAALAEQEVLIVSGLAFGIDSIAHKASLTQGLKTVAVLAHGLDRIYPNQNKNLAKQMVEQGGLLTDFRSGTMPDKQNFPKRNRIAAGVSDGIVVIESGLKGGSLITAEIANSYNKDVFAIPGRTTDPRSAGCNYLIKQNKAILVTSAEDILQHMNWKPRQAAVRHRQRELFVELTDAEKLLYQLIEKKENIQIDELYLKSGLSSSAAAGALLMLEMHGLVNSFPGKMYRIN